VQLPISLFTLERTQEDRRGENRKEANKEAKRQEEALAVTPPIRVVRSSRTMNPNSLINLASRGFGVLMQSN
jgi:hypothetical protein